MKLRKPDGSLVEGYEQTSKIKAGSIGDPHATAKGLSTFRLNSGEILNRGKDGKTFTVVQTGEVLEVV